ncbi:hypothetical protein [Nocardiopsis sp. MG754419]|uniref:hypothetical protein n=1 Tax=Nocardiopsis sp. MG754419 TaxID=2259865 RepID=UPI001BA5E491|nr:hypothetical protein [Nocardiopsis sp. MG754419]MBR8741682.1 hypothetical protein [Nocardiopsis sp. MG754419]
MNHGTGLRDRLHDHVALDEIELYAEVLIAVADVDHRLSLGEIDRALGLGARGEEGPSARPEDGVGAEHTPGRDARTEPHPAEASGPSVSEGPSPHTTAPAPRAPEPRSADPQAGLDEATLPNPFAGRPIRRSLPAPWILPRTVGEVHAHGAPHGPLLHRLAPWYI